MAIEALLLLCDLREGRAKIDHTNATLNLSTDEDLVTVELDKRITIPSLPARYLPRQRSSELRDLIANVQEFIASLSEAKTTHPTLFIPSDAARDLRKLREEARLAIYSAFPDKDHPARVNVDELIGHFEAIPKSPKMIIGEQEYMIAPAVGWLDEPENALTAAVVLIERGTA